MVSSSGIMSIPNFVDFQHFERMGTADFSSPFCGLFNDVVCSSDFFFRVSARRERNLSWPTIRTLGYRNCVQR